MVIRVRRHANISKQTTLLDGVDVGPSRWRISLRGLNRSVHEGMNDVSNVKVHLKASSGNENIRKLISQLKVVMIKQHNEQLCFPFYADF